MTNIVLDVNILMSALMKESLTREVIVKTNHNLWVPEIVFKKLLDYRKTILSKSRVTPKELDLLLEKLFEYIHVLPQEKIEPNLEKAKAIMDPIDPEDTIFVACALSIPDSVIWSNDRHLKKQKIVEVYTTREILKFL